MRKGEDISVMDLKGIAWAGNIYQKFEAMCVEVEEVMYQDTVKYLENQVQTVGSSVKKFYSEVMQDILPPDYVDPVKVAAADLPLNPYSHTAVNKKPKITIKHDLENLRKKKYEDYKVVGDINAEHKEIVAKRDDTIDHSREFSNSYSGNKRGAGLYRRHSVNSKGNYTIDIPSKMSKETSLGSHIRRKSRSVDKSPCTSTAQVDLPASGVNLSSDVNKPSLVSPPGTTGIEHRKATSFGQLSKESETCLASDEVRDAKEARSVDSHACTSSAQLDSTTSGVKLSSEIKEPIMVIPPGTASIEHSKATSFCHLSNESETCSASDGSCDAKEARYVDNSTYTSTAQVDSHASSINLSSDIKEPNLVIPPITTDIYLDSKEPAFAESNTDMICGSVPYEAVITSEGRSDDSEIDADSNDIELEIIERLDDSKFEDTCVLVEGNELQVVPQKKAKPKSYKKKFQEAFPLRMKSTRKQEYKKLAAQYSAHSSKQEEMEQNAEDVPDSEWELL